MTVPMPEGRFIEDEMTQERIITDLSGMMSGNIIYADSPCNLELSKWLNLDLSIMPPIYTPGNRVYLLKMADGTMAAIRFRSYMHTSTGKKGYVSFDYIYPLEF